MMTGVPSTMRPKEGERALISDTLICIRPMENTALMAATIEWSSASTPPMRAPPNKNSTTRSNGAIMLAVRRPISRTANSRMR